MPVSLNFVTATLIMRIQLSGHFRNLAAKSAPGTSFFRLIPCCRSFSRLDVPEIALKSCLPENFPTGPIGFLWRELKRFAERELSQHSDHRKGPRILAHWHVGLTGDSSLSSYYCHSCSNAQDLLSLSVYPELFLASSTA